MIQKLLIFLFKLYAKRVSHSFDHKLSNPIFFQEKLKIKLRKQYERSKRFKLSKVPFDELPVVEYDDLKPFVDGGLFREKTICFEETSGSSGQSKKIPYNSKLLKSFSRMFVIWAHDILSNIRFDSFKLYFSITPQFSHEESEGLENDSEYLGKFLAFFSKEYFVQIPNVKKIKDSDEFLMKLSLILISNKKLEIISIWSPTYLLVLVKFIEANFLEVKENLCLGEYKGIQFNKMILEDSSVKALFPSLKFISSWGSASAKKEFLELKELFHGVIVQKKGLLATEAPMTIPLLGHPGGIPLIDEVYFEFFDELNNQFNIAEVREGISYRLVISQKAGLLRYNIKDCVEVVGYKKSTPLLEFVGRRDSISDMFGEKLHEIDVQKAISNTRIRCLIPSKELSCYLCVIDESIDSRHIDLEVIEKILCQNIHYRNSIKLKQLSELRLLKISNLETKITEFHREEFSINSGDLKVSSLYYRSPDKLISFLKKL